MRWSPKMFSSFGQVSPAACSFDIYVLVLLFILPLQLGGSKKLLLENQKFSCAIRLHFPVCPLSGAILKLWTYYFDNKNHIHFAEVTWTFTHQFLLPAHYISFIFWPQISCDAKDKMLHILALLKFELIQKKVLIFVNSIDMAFRLRLFLEKVNHTNALYHYSLP